MDNQRAGGCLLGTEEIKFAAKHPRVKPCVTVSIELNI